MIANLFLVLFVSSIFSPAYGMNGRHNPYATSPTQAADLREDESLETRDIPAAAGATDQEYQEQLYQLFPRGTQVLRHLATRARFEDIFPRFSPDIWLYNSHESISVLHELLILSRQWITNPDEKNIFCYFIKNLLTYFSAQDLRYFSQRFLAFNCYGEDILLIALEHTNERTFKDILKVIRTSTLPTDFTQLLTARRYKNCTKSLRDLILDMPYDTSDDISFYEGIKSYWNFVLCPKYRVIPLPDKITLSTTLRQVAPREEEPLHAEEQVPNPQFYCYALQNNPSLFLYFDGNYYPYHAAPKFIHGRKRSGDHDNDVASERVLKPLPGITFFIDPVSNRPAYHTPEVAKESGELVQAKFYLIRREDMDIFAS